ncbi:hypothetical protein [Pseudomonas indica]|uniref:hypothetical protein n=1 Tax=Pseudomonas indica TaxID=137658 RepID=UPI0023F7814D|nr:hypothetical protein [Pseudomonas indica]MBU3054955.1 hypothetical protein [Pseudomonas indica]
MTSIPANLSHRHVDHESGHILYVDPATGDILVRKELTYRKDPRTEYETWAAKRRACKHLGADHAAAHSGALSNRLQGQLNSEPIKQDRCAHSSSSRGRPKAVFKNPVAAFMPLLAIPELLPWANDIVRGSICTSAGASNGKINVKARAVIAALFLSEISAEACQTSEYSLRTAQRIAKAARHAAHGIASYVERRPKLRGELEAELEPEKALLRTFQQ